MIKIERTDFAKQGLELFNAYRAHKLEAPDAKDLYAQMERDENAHNEALEKRINKRVLFKKPTDFATVPAFYLWLIGPWVLLLFGRWGPAITYFLLQGIMFLLIAYAAEKTKPLIEKKEESDAKQAAK